MLRGSLHDLAWRNRLPPVVREMLESLADPALHDASAGRHELGDDTFFVINEYETRPAPELRAESHRRYCDVQIMLSGTEQVGCGKLANGPDASYDATRDIAYYAQDLPLDWYPFGIGDVFIFAPDDIHLPGVTLDRPGNIRKVVGKLPWAMLAGVGLPAA
jgi:YhcH/YjgK/YiaL family protein